jgi:hypothetical protein
MCGFVLHILPYVGYTSYGAPTPTEIRTMYGLMCPRCGHVLEQPTVSDITIRPNGMRELVTVIEEAKKNMRINFTKLEYALENYLRKREVAHA